jgi:uncharacterized membrane protein
VEKPINIRRITLTALMAALIFVLTYFPVIPLGPGGFVHLGDVGITFAAAAFGPWVAMVAGGLGTALADVALGYPQWALFSFLVHGLQGAVLGLIIGGKLTWVKAILVTLANVVIVAGGYFLAGIPLIGGVASATYVPANIIQALSGSVVGLPLYWAVRHAYPPIGTYRERAL